MSTDTIAIVPVRSLTTGKTRLSPVVSPEVRSELTKRMLAVTLAACRASAEIDQIMVISPDVDVLRFAHSIDHEVFNLRQHAEPGGLIPALEQARSVSLVNRFATMIVLFADLPLLNGSDVATLTTAEGQVAIAPDTADVGTNGLLLRRGPVDLRQFDFHYGVESFGSHVAESLRHGIEPAIVRAPGLAFDLDTPDDLRNLIQIDPVANRVVRRAAS
jgi:2-phospho-L-lactate guanylyltransferase